jgi:DeoD family purine-nucleoside phosphorylase
VTATIHLHPTAPLADVVLLPGDPGRALALAQQLLSEPRMFNHNRGLWGYTGETADGTALTIQSTGMGGPSAAIVIAELYELGARRMVRVGTCGALSAGLGLGALVIATEAIADDGTSRALASVDGAAGAGDLRLPADPGLVHALGASAGDGATAGPIVSTDLFYDGREGAEREWLAAGALAVEMEAATLFALAARRGFEAAALLTVSDVVLPARVRIGADELSAAEKRMGEVAVRGLAALSVSS